MILELRIDNLAVFDKVEVAFQPGMNVISGETGAGKTLLLEALKLVLGSSPDPGLKGPRREEAYVEALFAAPRPGTLADLVPVDEDFSLARRISGSGARALVMGRSASASLLQQAGEELLSLTGQHSSRRLVSAAYQMDLLDSYAGVNEEALVASWEEWKEAKRKEDELREALGQGAQREDYIRAEVENFRALDPRAGEEDEIENDLSRLRHAADLRGAAEEALLSLSDKDNSAVDLLGKAEAALLRQGENDKDLQKLGEQISVLRENVSDAASEARDLREGYDLDPSSLQEMEERAVAISELRRRWRGLSVADIIMEVEKMEAELQALPGGEEELEKLEKKSRKAREKYDKVSMEARSLRQAAASKLAKAVEKELADLRLAEARFHINVEEADPSPKGQDKVEMLLQANPGLDPAPLSSGASGGELSRLLLALLLATSSDGGVYVFDEIDAGIGGDTAHVLAEKLQELSKSSQVIVITHLGQIARLADHHLLLEKKTDGKDTITELRALDDKERKSELARLIGASKEAGEEAERLLSRE